jgi:hypothetical protein
MPTTELDQDNATGTGAGGTTGSNAGPGGKQSGGRRARFTGATGKMRQSASDAYDAARNRTGALYGSARERASNAYEATRETAARARRRTADEFDANPMAALVGGLAVGALAAVLLPRTRAETAALGGIGGQINDRARDAAKAAREAGREKLGEYGLSREAARQKLSELASSAGEAVRSSVDAAARSSRRSKK